MFGRLRGLLFFGPAFKITRNKLLFKDDVQERLGAGVPGGLSGNSITYACQNVVGLFLNMVAFIQSDVHMTEQTSIFIYRPISLSAGDRNIEKNFKSWLLKCHTELDRTITFKSLASTQTQASTPENAYSMANSSWPAPFPAQHMLVVARSPPQTAPRVHRCCHACRPLPVLWLVRM